MPLSSAGQYCRLECKLKKVILVTGASSGLGEAIASALVERGHRVYGTRRKVGASETATPFSMLPLDVTDDTSVSTCVAALLAAEGRIDVLINNAGVGLCGAIEDTTVAEAQWQMDTNFFGPVRVIRAVLPHMRRQGNGRIITVSSLAGIAALPYQPYYSASKFALEALNESLRLELSGSGIDSTTINPGDFKTGFTAARIFSDGARSGLHAKALKATVSIYERDELNGAHPELVARLAARLVEQHRIGVRYTVGMPSQRFGIMLKRLLPATLFEQLMKLTYSLK